MRLLLTLLLAGCTFSPGSGFTTLTGAELEAGFELDTDRDLGDGAFLTDHGFEIRLQGLEIDLEDLELLEPAGAEAPEEEEDGHEGHSHRSVRPAAKAEADHADEEPGLVALLPVDRPLDLLEETSLELSRVEPSRELPLATISLAHLGLAGLRIEGTASGEGLEDEPLLVELPLDEHLEQELGFEIDRHSPERISLHIHLHLDGHLLDGLDLDTLAGDRGIVVEDPETEAGRALIENLLSSELLVEILEGPP